MRHQHTLADENIHGIKLSKKGKIHRIRYFKLLLNDFYIFIGGLANFANSPYKYPYMFPFTCKCCGLFDFS